MWFTNATRSQPNEEAELLAGCHRSSPSCHESQAAWEPNFHADNQ